MQTSHSLRTLHRVVAPYHGLPGKLTALRAIFAAAELTQAKVLVIVDPNGPATDPARVTELIIPVIGSEVEFLTPRYRRHPGDGPLVTQLVRPLVRALYGVALDEPLGAEFACSGRFASHCLEQSIWNREIGRFAIDLWLRTEAVAQNLSIGQIWRPATSNPGIRTTLREAVQQVMLSMGEILRAHDSFWLSADGLKDLRTWGHDPQVIPDPPTWDYVALAEQARHDVVEIEPLLEGVLEPASAAASARRSVGRAHFIWTTSCGRESCMRSSQQRTEARPAASTWPRCSCRSTCGERQRSWRTRRARTLRRCRGDSMRSVRRFKRLKPMLVSSWSIEKVRSR